MKTGFSALDGRGCLDQLTQVTKSVSNCPDFEPPMPQPTWITNIIVVPLFANILGILSIFVHVGNVFLLSYLNDHLPRNFPQGIVVIPVLFLAPLAVGAFDWWWRLKQPEADRWEKLLSPVLGGCFFMIPLWLLNWGAIVFVLGVVLCAWTSRLLR